MLASCSEQAVQNATAELTPDTASAMASTRANNKPDPTLPKAVLTIAPASNALPADVIAFKTRRDDCDHSRGEEPGDDEARAAGLADKLKKTCKGTDADLAALRRRYATDAVVTVALESYEDSVE